MEINKLRKRYYGKEILDIEGFNFDRNGILGIVGKNGTGKTTLLKCLSGHLIPNVHDVIIGDISFFPNDTVFLGNKISDLLELMMLSYPDFQKDKFKVMIGKSNLSEQMSISSLSRGQKVLLNISLTLSRDTEVYFLDEPYSNMDIVTTERVTKLLIDAFDSNEKLLVLTSHQFNDIERLLDYIAILDSKKMNNPFRVSEITENESILMWFRNNIGEVRKNEVI